MKYFCLVLIGLFSLNAAAQTWSCDDGDYHITVRATAGESTLKFQICEFTYCDANRLSEKATLTKVDQIHSEYTYRFSEFNTVENLVLHFNDNSLTVVKQMSDGVAIATFDNCTVN